MKLPLVISLIFALMLFSTSSSSLAQTTNSPPVLENIPNQNEDEGDNPTIKFFATDADPLDKLTFSSSPLPRFASLVNNGDRTASLVLSLSYSDAGIYPITITVTDNGLPQGSDSQTFTLEILDDGDPPEIDVLIENTIEEIIDMVEEGTLNYGQGNSLIVKLENAAKKITSSQNSAGQNILNTFINQVQTFVKTGKISDAEGQSLIDDIQIIIDNL